MIDGTHWSEQIAASATRARRFDATSDDSVAELIATTVDRFGRLDGLHHNAAGHVADEGVDAGRWGKENVRANAVAPALTLTEVVLAEERAGWKEQVLAGMAAPRLGEPGDIAALVAFLLSDDATWITGQTHHVNGGLLLN